MGKVYRFPLTPENRVRQYADEFLRRKKIYGQIGAAGWAKQNIPEQLRLQLFYLTGVL